MLIQFTAMDNNLSIRKEDHRREWLNYSKTNFGQLRKYFSEVNWNIVIQKEDIEEKWTAFLDIYNKGVEKWVSKRSTENLFKKDWYNRRCATARLEREKAWNKWKKNKRLDLWNNYIRKRNEYVKTHR